VRSGTAQLVLRLMVDLFCGDGGTHRCLPSGIRGQTTRQGSTPNFYNNYVGSSPISLLSLTTCSPALRARVDWPVS
jgi:hypothetical protein